MKALLSSPVTWSLVVTFVVGGLQAITPEVGSMWAGIIAAAVTVIGLVYHNNQIKTGKIA